MNLATLENSIAPDEPDAPEPEAPEPDTESLAKDAPADDSDQAPEEPEAGPAELDDEAQIKIGDETLTGKQLKAERLRQADYTRKTQMLAEDKRQFEQERDGLVEENTELKHWVSSLKDPGEMRFELERYFPETFDALREAIIQEAIEEQDMTPREKELSRKARMAEQAEKARRKDEELQARKDERRQADQRTSELRRTFNGWLDETMREAGLDPANEKHQKLVRREIQTAHQGKTWTKETFQEACAEIGAALGTSKPPADKKAALPPVAPKGNKPRASQAPKAKAVQDTESFFKSLRG